MQWTVWVALRPGWLALRLLVSPDTGWLALRLLVSPEPGWLALRPEAWRGMDGQTDGLRWRNGILLPKVASDSDVF